MMSDTIKSSIADGARDVNELKERVKEIRSLETMNKDDTLKMRLKHVGPSVALFFQDDPLKMVKGSGQYLYDELGSEYLDCINNVAHVGHGNKRVHEAVSKQLALLNTNSRFLHDSLSTYARRLTGLFPAHLSVCYLVNSGSEANDLALRLARAYTGRKDIVCVDGAYHGNLSSTMAISPYKNHKLHQFKQAKWAHIAPLPCSYRGMYSKDELTQLAADSDTIGRLYASETRNLIEQVKANNRQVAAFIVESMISCGGQTPLPQGYLAELQTYLRAQGILLICDEVQTGFGRCGEHMWAFQLAGEHIKPDIVTVGKPMGNGFPLAAVVTTPEIARAFQDIGTEYFNTFGGNPVSCAAGLAVLDEMEHLELMKHAQEIGSFMLRELEDIKVTSQVVGDVRGHGLFIGVDIVEDKVSRRASAKYAKFLVNKFRDEKILMSTEGKLGNVLKFKPPMVFSMDDARRFLEVFKQALVNLELTLSDLRVSSLAKSSSSSSSSSMSSSSSSSVASSSWLESSAEL